MSDIQFAPPPDWLIRLSGWCAYISGVIAIIGIIGLVLLYVGFFTGIDGLGPFGTVNDVAVAVNYILTIPIAITLHLLLRPHGAALSRAALIIGLIGMVAAIVLQGLLVFDVLAFERQIGMVLVAFLVILPWYIITGNLARASERLPLPMPLQVLAWFYFGYPVWAFKLGRTFLAW